MSQEPSYGEETFNCPYCGAFAHQVWTAFHAQQVRKSALSAFAGSNLILVGSATVGVSLIVKGLTASECAHCKELSLWVAGKLRWPVASIAPPAHAEMPDVVLGDYQEAASILSLSPRGSSALLRLCIQKLFIELKAGDDINKAIAKFSAAGLNQQLIHAMDILRVVGNNAVHPGEMDLKDDLETAGQLFELLNEIVDELISRPKRTARLYAKLPAGARAAIESRDKTSKG